MTEGPKVTVVLHGLHWPDAEVTAAAVEALNDAVPGAQVIEARDDTTAPRGPAALINDAVARAEAPVVVAIEAGARPDVAALRGVVDASRDHLVIASSEMVEPDDSGDFLSDLALLVEHRRLDAADARSGSVGVFGAPVALFRSLGGFDVRCVGAGYVEDLAVRARARGLPVRRHERAGLAERSERVAYPIDPRVHRFFAIRSALLTSFKLAPPATVGPALARVAAVAIVDAWHASGLSAETLAFGGSWGRAGLLARAFGARRREARALRDPIGVALPLLAIDSFLDLVPELVAERRGQASDYGQQAARRKEGGTSVPPGPAEAGLYVRSARLQAGPHAPGPSPQAPVPAVSVIVVNWNGRAHLHDCFTSILASDYPEGALEVICVDNGSTDGSIELLRRDFPRVQVVVLDRNKGFTGGNEAGVAASRGDVLVFLNNDMRVDAGAIRRLAWALSGDTQCAAARVLSWNGKRVDFVGGSVNFEGRGYQEGYGEAATVGRGASAHSFFPNGGAFAVTRDAYLHSGGFDPAFFAYYDDVDLGWRLRLEGSKIRVIHDAVVYHRHGATVRTQPGAQKRFLMERNALWLLMKNYGEEALRRVLGVALLLAVRRIVDEAVFDVDTPALAAVVPYCARFRRRVQHGQARPKAGAAEGVDARPAIRALPLESLAALGAALDDLTRVTRDRAAVQAMRRVADVDVLRHLGRPFEPSSSFASYKILHEALVNTLELPEYFGRRPRLLIVSHEAIGAHMSGPAIRFLELGRAVPDVARVTIAVPGEPQARDDRCTIVGYDRTRSTSLTRLAGDADVLFVQGFTLSLYPALAALPIPIVADLYCPFTLEHLEQHSVRWADGVQRAEGAQSAEQAPLPEAQDGDAHAREAVAVLDVQNALLDRADFFLCASELQRDFWLGNLHGRGRINPRTYAHDPSLRRLIDVVPFGVANEDIHVAADRAARDAGDAPGTPVLKGVWPGIGRDDTLLLWGGSLLDWQDPLTLIRAVAEVVPSQPDVKLWFMGTRHPNPLVAPMRVIDRSRALARDLGLLDTHVFFNEWVPYHQRARYLLEADIGVSTHRDHLETHFSFRTRMLDYVWAGLPIVCTRGDVFARLVESRGLGLTAAPGDAPALAEHIRILARDRAERSRMATRQAAVADEMRWSHVVEPLRTFLRDPQVAADRAAGVEAVRRALESSYRGSKWLKGVALRTGISEARIEQAKRSRVIRAAMSLRNRIALARAQRVR